MPDPNNKPKRKSKKRTPPPIDAIDLTPHLAKNPCGEKPLPLIRRSPPGRPMFEWLQDSGLEVIYRTPKLPYELERAERVQHEMSREMSTEKPNWTYLEKLQAEVTYWEQRYAATQVHYHTISFNFE